jgi:aspartate dehydrogenase
MTRKAVGLIGFGAIGESILQAWRTCDLPDQRLAAILVRPARKAQVEAAVPAGILVADSVPAFLAAGLHIAVEVAGHCAVAEHGERILSAGTSLMVLSVGSLADAALFDRLRVAAQGGGARILLPVGAIAGLDGLLALRKAGLSRVKYTSTKPPHSWKDTPAEQRFALDSLTERTVIFSGTAREAASLFPRNANLAAAVALAGLGFEDTSVELVADPLSTENVGCIEAEGVSSRLTVTVAGKSAASNPKTSQITGMSVLSALENEGALVSFV